MDFNKICTMFAMQEPFYGMILNSMNRRHEPACGIMAVGKKGNVFELLYNEDIIKQMKEEEVMEIIKHEVLHVAFNSFSLFQDIDPDDRHLSNVAADLEINSYLNEDKFELTKPLLCSDYGLDKMLGSKVYFKELKAQQELEQQEEEEEEDQGNPGDNQDKPESDEGEGDDTSPDSGNKDGNSNAEQQSKSSSGTREQCQKAFDESFDNHNFWPSPTSDTEAEQLETIIEDLLIQAADATEKAAPGKIPGFVRQKIDAIRTKKAKPVTDWKRYVRRYLGKEMSTISKKSYKRLSKRYPDAAGNRKKRKAHFLIAIDTSGSINHPDYLEFFSQIRTITKDATFHVVECDMRIQHEYDFNGRIPTEVHGGGGTSFEPVIDKFIAEKKIYDALIYFTDGYADIPKNTPAETLWVIASDGDQYDRNKYKINGASAVFIPKKH